MAGSTNEEPSLTPEQLKVVHAAMMEELGFARKDTLPLENKKGWKNPLDHDQLGMRIKAKTPGPAGYNLAQKNASAHSAWINATFDDVDEAERRLDSFNNGQSHRERMNAQLYKDSGKTTFKGTYVSGGNRKGVRGVCVTSSDHVHHAATRVLSSSNSPRQSITPTKKAQRNRTNVAGMNHVITHLRGVRSQSSTKATKGAATRGKTSSVKKGMPIHNPKANLSFHDQRCVNFLPIAKNTSATSSYGTGKQKSASSRSSHMSARQPTTTFSLASPKEFMDHSWNFELASSSGAPNAGHQESKVEFDNSEAVAVQLVTPLAVVDESTELIDGERMVLCDFESVVERKMLPSQKFESFGRCRSRLIHNVGKESLTTILEIEDIRPRIIYQKPVGTKIKYDSILRTISFNSSESEGTATWTIKFSLPWTFTGFMETLERMMPKTLSTAFGISTCDEKKESRSEYSYLTDLMSLHEVDALISFSEEDEDEEDSTQRSLSAFTQDLLSLVDDSAVDQALEAINQQGPLLEQISTMLGESTTLEETVRACMQEEPSPVTLSTCFDIGSQFRSSHDANTKAIKDSSALGGGLMSSRYAAVEVLIGNLLNRSTVFQHLPNQMATSYAQEIGRRVLDKAEDQAKTAKLLSTSKGLLNTPTGQSTMDETIPIPLSKCVGQEQAGTPWIKYSIEDMLRWRSRAVAAKKNLLTQWLPATINKFQLSDSVGRTTSHDWSMMAGVNLKDPPTFERECLEPHGLEVNRSATAPRVDKQGDITSQNSYGSGELTPIRELKNVNVSEGKAEVFAKPRYPVKSRSSVVKAWDTFNMTNDIPTKSITSVHPSTTGNIDELPNTYSPDDMIDVTKSAFFTAYIAANAKASSAPSLSPRSTKGLMMSTKQSLDSAIMNVDSGTKLRKDTIMEAMSTKTDPPVEGKNLGSIMQSSRKISGLANSRYADSPVHMPYNCAVTVLDEGRLSTQSQMTSISPSPFHGNLSRTIGSTIPDVPQPEDEISTENGVEQADPNRRQERDTSFSPEQVTLGSSYTDLGLRVSEENAGHLSTLSPSRKVLLQGNEPQATINHPLNTNVRDRRGSIRRQGSTGSVDTVKPIDLFTVSPILAKKTAPPPSLSLSHGLNSSTDSSISSASFVTATEGSEVNHTTASQHSSQGIQADPIQADSSRIDSNADNRHTNAVSENIQSRFSRHSAIIGDNYRSISFPFYEVDSANINPADSNTDLTALSGSGGQETRFIQPAKTPSTIQKLGGKQKGLESSRWADGEIGAYDKLSVHVPADFVSKGLTITVPRQSPKQEVFNASGMIDSDNSFSPIAATLIPHAPIYQTVLVPDESRPGLLKEVVDMVKLGSIPVVAHGPLYNQQSMQRNDPRTNTEFITSYSAATSMPFSGSTLNPLNFSSPSSPGSSRVYVSCPDHPDGAKVKNSLQDLKSMKVAATSQTITRSSFPVASTCSGRFDSDCKKV